MTPGDLEKWLVVLGALVATLTAIYKLIIQPITLAWKTREDSIKRLENDVERIRKERDEAWNRARTEMEQLQTDREEVSRKLQEALDRLDDNASERYKLQEELVQLKERNKRIEEESLRLQNEVKHQAGSIERQWIAQDAELSRINEATSKQLDNMRALLNASQVQITSLRNLYDGVKADLEATKMEQTRKIQELAFELENYRLFLEAIGLSDTVIDKIGEGKLLVEEAKTTIVTTLTKRDTSEVEIVPTTD